jgi:hypothetical protein
VLLIVEAKTDDVLPRSGMGASTSTDVAGMGFSERSDSGFAPDRIKSSMLEYPSMG